MNKLILWDETISVSSSRLTATYRARWQQCFMLSSNVAHTWTYWNKYFASFKPKTTLILNIDSTHKTNSIIQYFKEYYHKLLRLNLVYALCASNALRYANACFIPAIMVYIAWRKNKKIPNSSCQYDLCLAYACEFHAKLRQFDIFLTIEPVLCIFMYK